MSYSSVEFVWGVVGLILVLLVLASSILAAMLLHSKKIRKSERKFRALFERVFDGLILIDFEGNIVDLNESACRLLGFSKDDLDELKIDRLAFPNDFSDLWDGLARAFDGYSAYLGEFRLLDADKKTVHAEIGCTGLEIHGHDFVLASFRDITGRILAEQRLKEKNIALTEVLTHLEEEKMKIKKQISNMVDQVLMPSMNRLVNEDGSANVVYFKLLRDSLQEMASLSGGVGDTMTRLSPREMEICKLTRNGHTAKEIAGALNITVATVEKHKEKIRRKLNIVNKKINLASHLRKLSKT
jgi:PAS domain S-box-containing protein